MRTTKQVSFSACLLLVFMSFSNMLQAVSGAEIYYEYLGTNHYKVTLQVYRGCTEAALPTTQTVNFSSISCNNSFTASMNLEQSYEVSGLGASQIGNSTCNGGTLPGFELYVYTDTLIFPQTCSDWVIAWTDCCRNPDFTNVATVGSVIYIAAHVDTRFTYSSPKFNRAPLPYYCANATTASELHGPSDYPAYMDSFVTTLTCPLQGPNNCVSLAAGLSASEPFLLEPSTSIVIDKLRKKVFFDAVGNLSQLAAVATTIYQVKNGDTVGYVQSEVPIVISNNANCTNNNVQVQVDPFFHTGAVYNPNGAYHIRSCGGSTLIFSTILYDPDGDTISLHPSRTNLNSVFGANNVTVIFNTSPPYKPDSVQLFVQINVSSLFFNSFIDNQWKHHFKISIADSDALYPTYTALDMQAGIWRIALIDVPKLCPYSSSSVPIEIALQSLDNSSSPPNVTWRQLSGPPVIFSDTTVYNPTITTPPSLLTDSVVLEIEVTSTIAPVTGSSCTLRSSVTLYYDSIGGCPIPFPNEVVGAIRMDTNQNCIVDPIETRWPNYTVLLFEKGTDSLYYATPPTQDYAAYLDTGTYNVSSSSFDNEPYWSLCSPSQSITIDTTLNPQQLDWSLDPLFLCPKMQVNATAAPLRGCIPRWVWISYNNTGTLDAQNAYLELTVDTFLRVVTSTVPIASQVGSIYRFDLDTIPIGGSGLIRLHIQADCTTPGNTPYHITTHIYPDTICLNTLSNLVIQDSCDLDTAYFQVINYGAAHSTPLSYWIIENQVVVDTGLLQLGQGQNLQINYPMNPYKTYQLVVDPQTNNYAASMVLSCTGDSSYVPTLYTPNHQLDYVATIYNRTVNSYDPNIKEATPTSYGANNYLLPNIPIDYTIHFQNTGNDTAYQVVILDTLSSALNVGSLTMQGASHPYTWRIMPYNSLGYTVLEFTFDNILLTDSTTNEPASHGFVQYHIEQKPNLANFTRIENSAAIYFDLNAPIITNTTLHTICDNCYPFAISNNSVVITTPKIPTPDWDISIYPNPVTGAQLTIEQAQARPCTLELFSLSGILLQSKQINQSISTLDLQELPAGAYFLRVTKADSSKVFKVIRQ